MQVCDILSAHQVSVASEQEGLVRSKAEALRRLAALLAAGQQRVETEDIERVLVERERLQSTGVGGGVAIPHGAMEGVERLTGAVLLCPKPIDFDAIDGAPVSILVAVIGPKRATGEHLKTLARISRLLRDEAFRRRLLGASTGRAAFDLIAAEEGRSTS
ncbi:PTS fructose transporter subunit IIA [Sorangium cellulosum]|uniref:PTS fructose transporter subunit IIA n=1 Tax=Sorangium cellulosum TaxID=56 RepID=A0A4P2Q609_SORCE|nr:PTS sugar transporter subunit IIA [Sorangium cellulosum]AUX24671.1 PTS fructose transporter subunit IIA [Sorangium cellulosum]